MLDYMTSTPQFANKRSILACWSVSQKMCQNQVFECKDTQCQRMSLDRHIKPSIWVAGAFTGFIKPIDNMTCFVHKSDLTEPIRVENIVSECESMSLVFISINLIKFLVCGKILCIVMTLFTVAKVL